MAFVTVVPRRRGGDGAGEKEREKKRARTLSPRIAYSTRRARVRVRDKKFSVARAVGGDGVIAVVANSTESESEIASCLLSAATVSQPLFADR